MVPEGWRVQPIGNIAVVSSGGTPSRKNDDFWNGEIPWVTTSEVHFNIIIDTAQKITELGLKNSSAKIFPIGTILMAMYGQGKTRGQVAKLGIAAATNQACVAILFKKEVNVDYFYLFLQRQYKKNRALSNSGGQKNLSANLIKSIKVLIPPLGEQIKIAKILSTWDRTIETTEKLLAASQQQKKALMQQLLTGKKRFPNFCGEWDDAKFGDVLDIHIGGTPSRSKPEYWDAKKVTNNRWLSIRDLKGHKILDTSEYISELGVKNSNVTLIPAGTIVMSFKLTIGRRAFLGVDSYTNEAISALIIKHPSELNHKYLFYAIEIVNFEKEIDQAIKGKTLNKAKIKRLRLKLPKFKEQQKIASILCVADKEITTLQQKLDYLKQEKKALMQQLLTGKRRVKVDEDVVYPNEVVHA